MVGLGWACTAAGGWYYDSDQNPTRVFLCPASCTAAQQASQSSPTGAALKFSFGCATVIN